MVRVNPLISYISWWGPFFLRKVPPMFWRKESTSPPLPMRPTPRQWWCAPSVARPGPWLSMDKWVEVWNWRAQKHPVAPFSVRAFCTISSSSGPLQVYLVCISCGKKQVFLCSMHKMMWKFGCFFWKKHISLVFSSNFGRELCEI